MKTIEELYNNKKCDCGGELIFIDYSWNDLPNAYDGWAEIKCQKCNIRRGRWSGKVLEDGEEENVNSIVVSD